MKWIWLLLLRYLPFSQRHQGFFTSKNNKIVQAIPSLSPDPVLVFDVRDGIFNPGDKVILFRVIQRIKEQGINVLINKSCPLILSLNEGREQLLLFNATEHLHAESVFISRDRVGLFEKNRFDHSIYLNLLGLSLSGIPVDQAIAAFIFNAIGISENITDKRTSFLADQMPSKASTSSVLTRQLSKSDFIVLNPFVGSGFHRVSEESFSELIKVSLTIRNDDQRILLCGSSDDVLPVDVDSSYIEDLRCQLDLRDYVTLIRSNHCVSTVSFDTLTVHLGQIFGKKSYVRFRKWWIPYYSRQVMKSWIKHYQTSGKIDLL